MRQEAKLLTVPAELEDAVVWRYGRDAGNLGQRTRFEPPARPRRRRGSCRSRDSVYLKNRFRCAIGAK
jgi:hypothetical protein